MRNICQDLCHDLPNVVWRCAGGSVVTGGWRNTSTEKVEWLVPLAGYWRALTSVQLLPRLLPSSPKIEVKDLVARSSCAKLGECSRETATRSVQVVGSLRALTAV